MALDLKDKLREQLNDSSDDVWPATEKDNLLTFALDEVNRVRPRLVRDTIAAVADQDTYTLVNVYDVHRVDLLDDSNKVVMSIPGAAWEVWGDGEESGSSLYINPSYSQTGYSFRVHGYGPYDYTTNTPSSQIQSAILAVARAEALRRMVTERSRFETYATANPRSDTSVSEILGMVNDADIEAKRLLVAIRLIRRPTPGRV